MWERFSAERLRRAQASLGLVGSDPELRRLAERALRLIAEIKRAARRAGSSGVERTIREIVVRQLENALFLAGCGLVAEAMRALRFAFEGALVAASIAQAGDEEALRWLARLRRSWHTFRLKLCLERLGLPRREARRLRRLYRKLTEYQHPSSAHLEEPEVYDHTLDRERIGLALGRVAEVCENILGLLQGEGARAP